MNAETAGRCIGIRHRTKQTVKDEARPTQVFIIQGESTASFDLATEQDELDFVLGCAPVNWRKVREGETEEELKKTFKDHHIVKDDEGNLVKVPSSFIGLQSGDCVGMILGGSGDYFAFALSRKGSDIGAKVFRIPSFKLKTERGEGKIENDAKLLAELARDKRELFHEVIVRDRQLVRIRKTLRLRNDTGSVRIACGNRLRQRAIGMIFCNEEGKFPEGAIEKSFDEIQATDKSFQALKAEEARAKKDLEDALSGFDVYEKVFQKVDGCGPAIAARLISAIQDIRRFETSAKLKAFCGVHVAPGDEGSPTGKFVRRRSGQVSNWHPDARQALYLLMEQFNRRPGTEWGLYLRECKKRLRDKHPVAEVIPGSNKEKYTKGHIHKMAMWRCATRFTEWLHREWWKLERGELAEDSSDLKKAA